jgi:ABC-type glycerol-3-phosphate transport system substrate-binding protein
MTPASYNFTDIYPYISEGFRFPDAKGKQYGIPLTMETYMLFYRKDLFEAQKIDVASLKTVDDWMAALEKIKAAYKDQGISAAVIRGQDPTMPDELLAAVNDYWGNRSFLPQRMFYFDKDWKPQFTDPAVVNGFKLWAKLIDYGPEGSTSFTWNDAVRQFADGKAATYWFDASVFGSIFEDPSQSSVVGKVGYAAIPQTATGHGTTHWAWGLSMADKSKNKDNAWKFMEWATSPEIEQVTAPSTYGPVRASTWSTMSSKFGPEFSSAVDQNLKISVPGYMYFTGSGEVVDRIIDAVIKISQGSDADQVMKDLNDEAANIVQQNGLTN